MKRALMLVGITLCLTVAPWAAPAEASIIVAQTPTVEQASISDVDNNSQRADTFSLVAAATARSATWRGVFTESGVTFPVLFDLFIYGNTTDGSGNPIPDLGNVLASTSVTFSPGEFTDTGDDFVVGSSTFDVLEFQANLPPTALAAGTTYWFSVLADTTADPGNPNFGWGHGTAGPGDFNALRIFSPPLGFLHITNGSPLYFVLDDEALPASALVPEATSLVAWGGLGLLGCAAAAVVRRRTTRPEPKS